MELNLPESRSRSIRCIVKLGGAAITRNNELEKIHDENLEIVACQLRQAMMEGSVPCKVVGMDWSKRPGSSEIACDADELGDQDSSEFSKFVVVHGAGQQIRRSQRRTRETYCPSWFRCYSHICHKS